MCLYTVFFFFGIHHYQRFYVSICSGFIFQDLLNRTWYPKAKDHVNTDKPWYVVDATDKILGRLASTIAIHIRGKNLATYTPSVDMGAFVIVVWYVYKRSFWFLLHSIYFLLPIPFTSPSPWNLGFRIKKTLKHSLGKIFCKSDDGLGWYSTVPK